MGVAVKKKNTLEGGFAVPWLAKALKVSPYYVHKLLADVEPKGKAGKAVLYDLHDAAKMLVAKDVDWSEVLRTAKKSDLPAHLQREVWAAKRAEQDYRKDAGELFEADDVLELLSECFGVIRGAMRLLPDVLEREGGLNPAQRELVDRTLNDALGQWHKTLSDHLERNNAQPVGAAEP